MRRVIVVAALAWGATASTGASGWIEPGQRVDGPSEAERREIERAIERNAARLEAEGRLAPPFEVAVPLGWPLKAAPGFGDPGYHQTHNFVDHDPAVPNHLLDYNCGDRTYDVVIANHHGTDFTLWPFPWLKMSLGQITVVSAAAGTIVFKQNGQPDMNCSCVGAWNAVYVRHVDGSTAWYGHLKNGSLTSKGVGAAVAAGEYLGRVGSSGCSTTPHLHFELYNGAGQLQDPFAGPCNDLNPASWWSAQRPYYDTAVNKILMGSSLPESSVCGVPETTYETTTFETGDPIWFTTYVRDMVAGKVVYFRILRPDFSLAESWTYSLPPPDEYSEDAQNSHAMWAPAAPLGTWKIEVELDGIVHSRSFVVQALPPPAGAGRLGPTLMIGKPSNVLPLSWTHSSCNPNESRYVVFTGLIGNWNTGVVACDVSATSLNVSGANASGNRYYLVAPRNDEVFGSLGLDSNGAERAPPQDNCVGLVQSIACGE